MDIRISSLHVAWIIIRFHSGLGIIIFPSFWPHVGIGLACYIVVEGAPCHSPEQIVEYQQSRSACQHLKSHGIISAVLGVGFMDGIVVLPGIARCAALIQVAIFLCWRYQTKNLLAVQGTDAIRILASIGELNYTNYKVLRPSQGYFVEGKQYNLENQTYYSNYRLLSSSCIKNSIVMFLNSAVNQHSLNYLNKVYQYQNVWATYSQAEQIFQVSSFYLRVYELIGKKPSQYQNKYYLVSNDLQILTRIVLQISSNSKKLVQKSRIYYEQHKLIYMNVNMTFVKHFRPRNPYAANQRLSQEFDNHQIYNYGWKLHGRELRPPPQLNLSVQHMLRAMDRQQVWYLPDNHSIIDYQYQEFDQKYNISHYKAKQNQVRFCVTILNHNNVQYDRYRKLMMSLLNQVYENYHIVFIDDASDDNNTEHTRKYVEEVGFPQDRIVYIQNKRRLYATYNILNGIYNYCDPEDVQLLLDGDDQLLGKYAFQVMNSAYQADPNIWVAYSNYKWNIYQFGRSRIVRYDSQHKINNRRVFLSVLGPIRTWRAKLLYNIPLSYHSMANSKILDTGYDDALAHCLFQLAGASRTRYVPQILYEYNRNYGGNDDALPRQFWHRNFTAQYMLTLKPLTQINSIQNSQKDPDVFKMLQNGKNIDYFLVVK